MTHLHEQAQVHNNIAPFEPPREKPTTIMQGLQQSVVAAVIACITPPTSPASSMLLLS